MMSTPPAPQNGGGMGIDPQQIEALAQMLMSQGKEQAAMELMSLLGGAPQQQQAPQMPPQQGMGAQGGPPQGLLG
jgi:hypothetical protein